MPTSYIDNGNNFDAAYAVHPQNVETIVAELKQANQQLREARRAALNIMEDAVLSKEELRKSDEQLQTALKAANSFTWVIDPQTGNTSYSENYNEVLGFEAALNAPHNFNQIHPDDKIFVLQAVNKAMRGEAPLEVEHRIIHPETGDIIWLKAEGKMMQQTEGGPQVFVGVTKNITSAKEAQIALRESEERLQITMDAAVDYAIITTNKNGVVIAWSKGAEHTFGYCREQMIGKPASIIFTPEDIAAGIPEKEMETARSKGIAVDDRWHNGKDGIKLYMSGTMRPIYDPELKGYVKVSRERTKEKLLEQEREDFISIASHELKTPVTSIKAYSELLLDIFNELEDASSAGLLQKLNGQVDRLIDLIHALLDTSKISQGSMILNKEKFDLNTLLKERVKDMEEISFIHRFILPEKEEIFITADRERIGQVITNFISNAVKYSPNGGTITIGCKQENNKTEVSVKDEGIGISEHAQRKVFDRFFRIQTDQMQNYPGMGLGLYITANIIRCHSGNIWVTSKPGEGSVFYFSIPDLPQEG